MSAGMRRATSSATALLPEAVGPKRARTRRSVTQSGAGLPEILVRRAPGFEETLDASVAPLELVEDAVHGFGGRGGDAPQALPLLLVLGLRDPLVVARAKTVLADGVVGGDVVVAHAGEVKEKGRQQARAVFAAGAVDDH